MMLVLTAACLSAQNANVSGQVKDPTNSVVPSATITVLNKDTGSKRIAITNSEGIYSVVGVIPGRYVILAAAQGFQTTRHDDIILEVAQNARFDFQLTVGATEQTVTVTAEPPIVNRTDASVSTVVDRRFVENLPLNGRSFQSLMLLTPGVVTTNPQVSAAQPGYYGEMSVNGQRAESNQYIVDGVSANNGNYIYGYQTAGSAGALPSYTTLGTTQSLVSIDALQEFRVLTSTYSAEYGRSPGGQFTFLTRSGTNQWHGTAYDYIRNDAFDANDWFNNFYQRPRPAQHQNDFGGTSGGSILKDRTFFFVSYEGLRLRQPLNAIVRYVPSLALRAQAPAALQPALNAFPKPNGADFPDGLSEYILTDSLPSHVNSTSVRLDHNFGSKLTLFFRFSDSPSESTTRSGTQLQPIKFTPQSFTWGANGLLTPVITNEFRLALSRNSGGYETIIDDIGGAQPTDLLKQQGIDIKVHPTAYVFVGLYFARSSFGVTQNTAGQSQRQWNLSDSLSWTHGRNQFKFGANYLRTASALRRTDPYIYVLFADQNEVLANKGYQGATILFGKTTPVYESLGAFVHDECRVSSRLALSMGLRWEINPAPHVTSGLLPYAISGNVYDPSSLGLAPQGEGWYKTAYLNFAPRLGLSYVARGGAGRETVLRAGGGVFFDTGTNVRNGSFDSSPGITYTKYYGPAYGTPNPSFPLTPEQINVNLADSFKPPYGTLYGYDRHMQLPYTLQWNVSLQQALGSPQAITLSYVGAVGRRLLSLTSFNVAKLNPDFTYVTMYRTGLTSDYHAFQAQFQRSLSHGLQALASYTWSHSIDYGSLTNTLPSRRGDSDFDLRQNFNTAVTYQLPGRYTNPVARALLQHWGLDGRFTLRSGFPVSLNGTSQIDPSTGQSFNPGLDLVPGVPVYVDNPNVAGGRLINPAAFKAPAGSLNGTAPRNFARGFGATQLDVVLRREFQIAERFRLQFRAEAFNVANHPNFGRVNPTLGNPLFGQAISMLNSSLGGQSSLYQQGGPRSMQLALKLVF
jgi:hypothetical protein